MNNNKKYRIFYNAKKVPPKKKSAKYQSKIKPIHATREITPGTQKRCWKAKGSTKRESGG